MIVAVKDELKINVRLFDEKVAITLMGMDDIGWFWDSWIAQEEQLAEKHLRTKHGIYAYNELADYLQQNGWQIADTSFSNS